MKSVGFTVSETAKMMGVKQEVVYHLVNNSLIETHIDPAGFKRGRLISLEEMKAFEQRFVALSEIAYQRNVCSRSMMVLFSKKGIAPAIGGSVDGCRQIFYKREDVS